jgi:CRISPR-associated protein Cas1
MIKRTIEISREPAHLAVKLDQLLIYRYDQAPEPVASIPCEDIGLVLVDHVATTYSHQALATLMGYGAAVLVCGRDHLPAGLLLPMPSHTEVVWRIQDQIATSKPLLKRLWQQIVVAKVRAQARNIDPDSPAHGLLSELAREVKSGDSTNVEAQAARVYWAAWLDPSIQTKTPSAPNASRWPLPESLKTDEARFALATAGSFKRDPDHLDPLNIMLNYGYAVLRAAVARALVAAGLFPALGLHHRNRSNAFCLADDMVEPLRPLIDARVRDLHRHGRDRLDQLTKAYLLEVLDITVRTGDQTGPLMVCLHRMVASLVHCYQGRETKLLIPEAD